MSATTIPPYSGTAMDAEGVPKPSSSGNVRNFGICHWMERVLEECEKAGRDFEPEAVHDLRVALRRCRSLADGMRLLDPDRTWRKMRHAAKPLFSALGELRDAQVLKESLDALGVKNDLIANALMEHASREEARLKNTASEALQKFDRKQWDAWIDHLSGT